ncbi:MAG TPA: Uma2 family endonuclease [Gammaproteobacteria bacterium]|nr:Uma2 family endonuclease [Gammaproteobacteria bacterium]
MIEVKSDLKTMDLPYLIQFYGVTETMFDELIDEDTKAELIDGVMIVHSPASTEHDDLSGFIRALMRFYADAKGLGKVLGPDSLIHLGPGRKCAPDVFFVPRERVPMPLPKEFAGVPDLVLEILSPSNRRYDLHEKRLMYRDAGVGEMWFMDPEFRQVIIDRPQADGYAEEVVAEGRIFSTAMEGFWLNTSWLWAKPLPNAYSCLQEILHQV